MATVNDCNGGGGGGDSVDDDGFGDDCDDDDVDDNNGGNCSRCDFRINLIAELTVSTCIYL